MTTLPEQFSRANRAVCERCFADPNVLKKEAKNFPEVLARLQGQAKKETQGLGNKETDHEVCFAAVLEENGFTFLLKKKKGDHLKLLKNLADGLYYIYQVNGSQQSLDYQTILVENKAITKEFTYDLKHTTSDTFYLNDGWFLDNILYLITFSPDGVNNKTLLALGQTIPTEVEKKRYAQIVEAKKLLNAQKDDGDSSLLVVHRFANRYKCTKFTEEWSKVRLAEVIAFLQ